MAQAAFFAGRLSGIADRSAVEHDAVAEVGAVFRREYLPEGSILQEGENLRFLATQVRFYRGSDFLLAAQETEPDTLFGAELLGSTAAAPGILKALGCVEALNFDGGGSTKLYLGGQSFSNNNRAVVTTVGIVTK